MSDFVVLSSWTPDNLMLVQHQNRTYLEWAGFKRWDFIHYNTVFEIHMRPFTQKKDTVISII